MQSEILDDGFENYDERNKAKLNTITFQYNQNE